MDSMIKIVFACTWKILNSHAGAISAEIRKKIRPYYNNWESEKEQQNQKH